MPTHRVSSEHQLTCATRPDDDEGSVRHRRVSRPPWHCDSKGKANRSFYPSFLPLRRGLCVAVAYGESDFAAQNRTKLPARSPGVRRYVAQRALPS